MYQSQKNDKKQQKAEDERERKRTSWRRVTVCQNFQEKDLKEDIKKGRSEF